MFSRPPLFPTVALVLGIALCVFLFITPIEGASWLPALAPLSFGVAELRKPLGVIIPSGHPDDCEPIGSHATVWSAIASTSSGSDAFRHLFLQGNANGRLYALIGLTQLKARGLGAAMAEARKDTSEVYIWRRTVGGTHTRLQQVAVPDTLRAWAHLLRGPAQGQLCDLQ